MRKEEKRTERVPVVNWSMHFIWEITPKERVTPRDTRHFAPNQRTTQPHVVVVLCVPF
jgi:hypothetical protein